MIQHFERVSPNSTNLYLARDLPHLKMLAAGGNRLLKIKDTEGVSTYFALLREQGYLSRFHCFRNFRCSNCGRVVVDVCVQDVLSRGKIDRRVRTADIDEGLGIITCERALFSHLAKQETSWRSTSMPRR